MDLLNLVGKLIINTAALLVVDYLIPGFELESMEATLVAAVVIGVINHYIRPIVQILALPLSIATLGIAAFLINVLLLMLAAEIVPGFEIDTFVTAAVSSILLMLVNGFLYKLTK